jgi:hypothetical protein
MSISNDFDAFWHVDNVKRGLASLRILGKNGVYSNELENFRKYLGSVQSYKLPDCSPVNESDLNEDLRVLKARINRKASSAIHVCLDMSDKLEEIYFSMMFPKSELPCEGDKASVR